MKADRALLLLRDADPAIFANSPTGLALHPEVLVGSLARHDIAGRCLAQARTHRLRAEGFLAGLPGDVSPLRALAEQCVERCA